MIDLGETNARAVEAEQALLGALLVPLDGVPTVPELSAADFVEPLHAEIFQVIATTTQAGRKPDAITVHAALAGNATYRELGGGAYLKRLAQAAGFADLDDYAETVRGLSAKRRLFALASDLVDQAATPGVQADEALAAMWQELDALRSGTAVKPVTYRDVLARHHEALTTTPAVFSTGLQLVDSVLEGGLYAGKVYAFAARMKVGKTLMLSSIAQALNLAGVPALYVALEMGATEIGQRIVGRDLGFNSVRFLRRDDPTLANRIDRYRQTAPNNLFFEDRPGLSLERLRGIVSGYVAKHGVRVVLLDYWQLVSGQRRGQTQADHLGEVAQWLADAAKALNIAVVTAAQINREGETRGGDGLRLACSVYFHMHKVERVGDNTKRLWLEMQDTRYTPSRDVGSEAEPLLYIDMYGPSIGETA